MTPPSPAGLLAAAARPETFAALHVALAEIGLAMDLACDLATARRQFYERGGHDLLVLASDLAPGVASSLVQSLRALDPKLRIVVYGRDLLRGSKLEGVTRLGAHHPATRAGVGALLKILRAR